MRYLLIIFLLLNPQFSYSQNFLNNKSSFDEIMADINDQVGSQELNYIELYEVLFQLYQNPFNINTASAEQLNLLIFLNEIQIKNIIEQIKNNGDILSIYELQAVPNLSIHQIKLISSFIKIEPSKLFFKNINEKKSIQNIIIKTDFKPNITHEPATFLRYKISFDNGLSIGYTAKNEIGEKYSWNPKTNTFITDFYALNFEIKNKGRLKSLIIGDFKSQFGQGLVFASGFNIDKSTEAISSIKKGNIGTKPHTSSLESGFFRGISSTISTSRNSIFTAFISHKFIDAKIDTNTNAINSISNSGIHKTNSEQQNKASAMESNFGGNFQYSFKELKIGINFIQTNFSLPLIKPANNYNKFSFCGYQNRITSINYSYNWNNINTFGEIAISNSGGTGSVFGVIAALSSKMDLSCIYRNYDKNFHSFYGNGFGESSNNVNEKGFYIGIKHKFNSKITASASIDRYKYQWIKYLSNAPTYGYEYLINFIYTPQKNIQISTQHKFENKQKNSAIEENIHSITDTKKSTSNLLLVFALEKDWQFKTGLIASKYLFENETSLGKVIYQDIQCNLKRIAISIRTTQFNTSNYNARIYVHESDLPSSFTMPSYSGIGTKNYILLKIKVYKDISFCTKLINLNQFDETSKKTIKTLELKLGIFGNF